MTSGHKHRIVSVKRDGLVHRVLKCQVFVTSDLDRVDRSPYPYGPVADEGATGENSEEWYLSLLGILHRWTGLTLRVPYE